MYDRDYEKEFNCVKQAASKNCIVNYQKWEVNKKILHGDVACSSENLAITAAHHQH